MTKVKLQKRIIFDIVLQHLTKIGISDAGTSQPKRDLDAEILLVNL